MSPLARSLLALACAALLHAARAQYGPDKCKTDAKGIDGERIDFPIIYLNASLGSQICFDTRDKNGDKNAACQKTLDPQHHYEYELVGVSALACDYVVEPDLTISDDLTTICVRRNWRLEPDATLEIWEFCLPK